MKHSLYINDTNIGEYGIFISSDTYLDAPLIDYTAYQIPARDGDVILNNKRLNNVIRKFVCYIPDNTDVNVALNKLKKLLYSEFKYLKLVSDYNEDVYQYGYLAQEISVEPFNHGMTATFELYFSCLPYKYLTSNPSVNLGNFGTPATRKIVRNDNKDLLKVLAQAKNDYPYSFIGWYLGSLSSGFFNRGETFWLITNSNVDKYILLLKATYSNDTVKYTIIEEVDRAGRQETYFEAPDDAEVTNYSLVYALPVLKEDVQITTEWGLDDHANFSSTWIDIENTALHNDDVIGSSPVLLMRKLAISSQIDFDEDKDPTIDIFYVNNNIYTIDFKALCDDYTRRGVFDYFAHDYSGSSNKELYILLDLKNGICQLLDTYSFDGNVILDMSKYVQSYIVEDLGDDINIQYASIKKYDKSNTAFINDNYPRVECKLGWWIL